MARGMNNRSMGKKVHVEQIGVRCQVNINLNLKYKEWDGVYLIDLAQDREQVASFCDHGNER